MFKRRGGPNGAQERAADTHAEEEASATAYDTDHDGKLDLVETMLRNYDTDHNGRFSNADVKGIVTDVLQARRSAKRYGRWAAALVVAMLVLIGSMFGAAYVADISTRELFLRARTRVQRDSAGRNVRFGAAAGNLEQHDARRRRLRELHGRQLIEVALLNNAKYTDVVEAIEEGNITSGVVQIKVPDSERRSRRALSEISEDTIIATGNLVRRYTREVYRNGEVVDETVYDFRELGGAHVYTMTASGEVLASSRRRLERLTAEGSAEHHRRLAAVAKPPPRCHVYHCFAGDAGCTEPSEPSLCMAWSPDGTTCDEPACAYVAAHGARAIERAAARRHQRRLDNDDDAVSCTSDQDCHAAIGAPRCKIDADDAGAGECVECLSAGDCSGNDRCEKSECEDCFPAHATVTTPAGPKRMDKIEIGDRVLVDGAGTFSTVYFSAHADRRASAMHEYVRLELSSGGALELSPGHLAIADGAYTAAAHIRVGMAMRTAGGVGASVVTSATRVRREGLFAPLTLHGDVVVDGVVTSAYATFLGERLLPTRGLRRSGAAHHALAHLLAAPLRALYAADPSGVEAFLSEVRRTTTGGFAPFALTGGGGLLAVAEGLAIAARSAPVSALAGRAVLVGAGTAFVALVAFLAAAANVAGVAGAVGAAVCEHLTRGYEHAAVLGGAALDVGVAAGRGVSVSW